MSVHTTSYGVTGNGITDDSANFQTAVNAANTLVTNLIVDDGTFLINTRVVIPGAVAISPNSNNHLFKSTNTGSAIFSTDGSNGASVSGLNALCTGTSLNTTFIYGGYNTKNFTMNLCNVTGAAGFAMEYNQVYNAAQSVSPGQNITITNNTIVGNSTNGYSGIEMRYVQGGTVSGNNVSKCVHGIMFWGGDSNPLRNGANANPRLATNINTFNNIVHDVSRGGIWGSMGNNCQIYNNTVYNCGDVGIDYEGCSNSTATQNYAYNCANGCYTAFFYSTNVTFSNNLAKQPTINMWSFAVYNNGGWPKGGNTSITLNSNTFDTGKVGQDYVTTLTTNGGNKLKNGSYQNWTAGTPNFLDNGVGAVGPFGPIVPILTPIPVNPYVFFGEDEINGTALLLMADGVPVGHSTNFVLKIDAGQADTTQRGSTGYKEQMYALRSWSIAIDGLVAFDDPANSGMLITSIVNKQSHSVMFSTMISGDTLFSGTVLIPSFSENGKVESVVTYASQLQGTGPIIASKAP